MQAPLAATPWRRLPATLGLALAYGLLSWLTFSRGLDQALPLFPATGVAVGVLLVRGFGVLPGVALGALAADVLIANGPGGPLGGTPWLTLSLVLVKTAHAALAAWLLRRFSRPAMSRLEPAERPLGGPGRGEAASPPASHPGLQLDTVPAIGRFAALGGLGCVFSATLASGLLAERGLSSARDLLPTWLGWWLSDTLGVLLITPMVLALLAEPRGYWRPRLVSYALPQLMLAALTLGAIIELGTRDAARVRLDFARAAERAAQAVQRGLEEPAMSLRIAALNMRRSEIVEIIALDEALRLWGGQPPHVLSSGWAPLRSEGGERVRRLQPRHEVAHTSPPRLADVDFWRLPGAPQRLAQVVGRNNGVAGLAMPDMRLALLLPVAEGRGTPDPLSRVSGALFIVVDIKRLVVDAMSRGESGVGACLLDRADAQAPAEAHPIGGDTACLQAGDGAALKREVAIDLPYTMLALRVVAGPSYLRTHRGWTARALSQSSLIGVFAVGMLLLMATARAARDSERAERSEALIDQLFQTAPFGIVLYDSVRQRARVNPAFAQLVGYSDDELASMSISFSEITHPDDRAADAQRVHAILHGETPPGERIKRYVRKDGSVVHVRIQNAVKRGARGEPLAALAVVEDIGERLRLAELEESANRAEAANRAKTEFLSRMSHELRTPLNAMLGFAQLLTRDPGDLSLQQREQLTLIERSGWHLLAMIEDVLDLSHIESGTVRLSIEPVSLAPLLRDALRLLAPEAERAVVALTEPVIDADAATVRADATRLRQVLTNLLSNAIKYNRTGGAVEVSARRERDGRIAITVRDTGLGLSDSQLARLYEPFNRLGRESSGKPGTGIGLAITRRLVELMQGELRVHSEPEEGTAFTVLLTAAEAPRPAASREPRAPPRSDYGPAQVLYIEDNEVNLELMAAVLSHRPQVRLITCDTGAEGLAALRSEPRIDLLLLDMHLPDIDGLRLLELVKCETHSAHIPVIVVSADALSEQVQAALEAGAVAYVTKPLNLDDALREIDRVLAARR